MDLALDLIKHPRTDLVDRIRHSNIEDFGVLAHNRGEKREYIGHHEQRSREHLARQNIDILPNIPGKQHVDSKSGFFFCFRSSSPRRVRCLGIFPLTNQIPASSIIESRELTGSPSSMQTASTRSTSQLIEQLRPTTTRIPGISTRPSVERTLGDIANLFLATGSEF